MRGIDGLAACPGDYVLVLRIASELRLDVGRLGPVRIFPGWALYIGSARGPGGLRARLERHARPAELKRRHWHIDFLTAAAPIREVWYYSGELPLECRWAELIYRFGHPVEGFGASDCQCTSHLFTMATYPSVKQVYASLAVESRAEIIRGVLR